MSPKLNTVTEYMRSVPPDSLDALTELREICLQTLRGFHENMDFGMPGYTRTKQIEVAWDFDDVILTIYVYNEQVFKNLREEMKGMDTGKTWIRFKKLKTLDLKFIARLLQEVVALPHEILG
jgi:uncharacterized protein YdhG (YjbR/CyaY superfamily)